MDRTLRICLVTQGDASWIGGMEYTRNLLLALAKLPDGTRSTFEICLLIGTYVNREFIKEVEPFVRQIYYAERDLPASILFSKPRWKLAARLQYLRDYRHAVFFATKKIDFVYPYCGLAVGTRFVNSAAWIPDFQHKFLPGYFAGDEIYARDRVFSAIADRASRVVLSSESVRLDFKRFFPRAAHKSTTLPFRTVPNTQWYSDDPSSVRERYSLPCRFFLVCNQFWQHKNHALVFEALKLLKTRRVHPIIVCTGQLYDYRRPDYSSEILQTIQKSGLAGQVHLLGLVPKADQIQLMRCSIGVIQPSLFEGWSTVVEDARCMGKTTILSDIAVHIEQNPPHSHYFPRNSAEALAEILSDLWSTVPEGPIPDHEAEAFKNSARDVQEFGTRFLQLARGTPA